ncbi:hypothetical protein BC939DRAFT_482442 [Gamsiella multidivaricata]|uniref:uncharacterized protein n=1 Tax=Gamsiella multidivaricata TaxID=101098 RepID=UPI00222057E7|nr:uncharacterized protein BC939DRAFT_482442 [Gamsiella multidivaricata]KAI7815939.1 hypothetical protein BC939DRAFT_482442 [Gamsiella multidivaricata]
MAPVYSLILLATLLAGSGQRQRFPALAHASQKPADYFLPPNIYDNLPSGIQTPVAIPAAPSPTSAGTNQRPADYFLPTNIYDNLPPGLQTPAAVANALPASSTLPEPRIDDGGTKDGSISAPSGPDDPPTIKITTPLTNALYTPGSNLVMTWTNNPITFPGTWIAPQSLIGMITNDPSFSHSPLLTEGDMNNLAKMKLESMKHTQMASAMKDSPIFLSTLRLVSWPLTSSGRAMTKMIQGRLWRLGRETF